MLAFYLALIDDQNDKEKFEQIYHKYKDMMYQTAMNVLKNPALAEEAVQDSFINIAKRIADISDPLSKKTVSFIIIIVRNTAINNLKKERADEHIPFDENEMAPEFIPPDFDQIVTDNKFGGIVDAIDSIDKIYSDALKLKYIYGYSNGEIAEFLGITQKNAEMRIYRGKEQLKQILEGSDDDSKQ